MPRTGGVYTPPAGTKATANTTILSAPYNSFVDDLTADANAPRPITAGGTGATSASAARSVIGADNASNLVTGTLPAARMAGDYAFANLGLSGGIKTDAITTNSSQQVVINAGESVDFATGQAGESIYLNAESGVTVTTSPDNWVSGWAGRLTAVLKGDSITLAGNVVWHAGNDGAGSGLDADKVDGYEAASLYRNNANHATSGNLVISNSGPYISLLETNDASDWQIYLNGGVFQIRQDDAGDGTFEAPNAINLDRAGLRGELWGQKIWTAGNDGAGSTLDADLLDGQQGAFYQNASNLNAGILPNARISGAYDGITTLTANVLRLESTSDASETSTAHAFQIGPSNGLNVALDQNEFFVRNNNALATDPYYFNTGGRVDFNIPGGANFSHNLSTAGVFQITNSAPQIKLIDTTAGQYSARMRVDGNNVYFDSSTDDVTFGEVFRFELDTKIGYVASSRLWTDAYATTAKINGIIGYTPANAANSIVAGNGMSGGGTLAASRTITLGTPSPITNSTTDSVTSTSHTHSLGFIAAEVSTTTSASTTSFPLGHVIICFNTASIARNATFVPAIYDSEPRQYVVDGYSGAGATLSGTWRTRGWTDSRYLMQRVA